jgi:hypothetical protein
MSRYYTDIFKFENGLLTLSAINLPFVSDNYKFDFSEVWQSLTILPTNINSELYVFKGVFQWKLFRPFKQDSRINQETCFHMSKHITV